MSEVPRFNPQSTVVESSNTVINLTLLTCENAHGRFAILILKAVQVLAYFELAIIIILLLWC